MLTWSGPLLAAAALLVAAGVPKVAAPAPAVRALRSVGLRVPTATVRAGGAAEAVVGLAGILLGTWWAALLVAASYLAFGAFVVVALRRGGVVASCGCFGKADTPPTVAHVVVNGLLAAGAMAATVRPPGRLDAVLAHSSWAGLPLLAYAAGAAALAYYALAVLPLLSAAPTATGSVRPLPAEHRRST